MAFDRDPRKLRRVMEHVRYVETSLADEDAIAEAVASADVVIGAVLVAGRRTPHVVTRAMVERMKPGAASIAVAQSLLPYVLTIAKHGVMGALEKCRELARGVCTLDGVRA